MKINMWKLLLAGLFASAALAGCEDNRNNFMVDDTISFVNEEQYAGVSVYNGKYELAILKNGKGQQSAKALLSVSETALAEYNTANGTNYAVLPATYTATCRICAACSPSSAFRTATPVNSSRLRGTTQPSSPWARVRSMRFRSNSPSPTTRWPSMQTAM